MLACSEFASKLNVSNTAELLCLNCGKNLPKKVTISKESQEKPSTYNVLSPSANTSMNNDIVKVQESLLNTINKWLCSNASHILDSPTTDYVSVNVHVNGNNEFASKVQCPVTDCRCSDKGECSSDGVKSCDITGGESPVTRKRAHRPTLKSFKSTNENCSNPSPISNATEDHTSRSPSDRDDVLSLNDSSSPNSPGNHSAVNKLPRRPARIVYQSSRRLTEHTACNQCPSHSRPTRTSSRRTSSDHERQQDHRYGHVQPASLLTQKAVVLVQ
ncbi:hypothetical protein FOCC_FOCC014456, partial [Frankliniella occidentalis]